MKLKLEAEDRLTWLTRHPPDAPPYVHQVLKLAQVVKVHLTRVRAAAHAPPHRQLPCHVSATDLSMTSQVVFTRARCQFCAKILSETKRSVLCKESLGDEKIAVAIKVTFVRKEGVLC